MALKRVKYEDGEGVYRVEGGGEIGIANDGAIVMPIDVVADVSVAYLEAALRKSDEYYGVDVGSLIISDTPSAQFDPDTARRVTWLSYEQGRLSVEAGYGVDEDPVPRAPDLGRLVAPILSRHRASWAGMWSDDDQGPGIVVFVTARLTGKGRSMAELYDLDTDLQSFLGAVGGDSRLSARTAADLVKGGLVRLLLGQPEGLWLDAKRDPHAIRGGASADPQKWELAKDVVAFANTGADSLILFGVQTANSGAGDVLDSLHAFELTSMNADAVRAILRERVTPDLPNVEVGVVESQNGYGYGYIFIPAQPAELLPFIVSGVLIGGRYYGTHLSIPVRSTEHTAYTDASALHSMLAAGRVALRQTPAS
jgi:hypothetical protein